MEGALTLVLGVFAIASFVGSAVWAVSRIHISTSLLRQSITHLSTDVGTLTKSIDRLDERLHDHERRIIHLEAQSAGPGNRTAVGK